MVYIAVPVEEWNTWLTWRKSEIRYQNVKQLKKVLDEYEDLGDFGEDIEKKCFESATTEKEYLEKLAKILLDRKDSDCDHYECDICSFLRKVTAKDWTLLSQIEI